MNKLFEKIAADTRNNPNSLPILLGAGGAALGGLGLASSVQNAKAMEAMHGHYQKLNNPFVQAGLKMTEGMGKGMGDAIGESGSRWLQTKLLTADQIQNFIARRA